MSDKATIPEGHNSRTCSCGVCQAWRADDFSNRVAKQQERTREAARRRRREAKERGDTEEKVEDGKAPASERS